MQCIAIWEDIEIRLSSEVGRWTTKKRHDHKIPIVHLCHLGLLCCFRLEIRLVVIEPVGQSLGTKQKNRFIHYWSGLYISYFCTASSLEVLCGSYFVLQEKRDITSGVQLSTTREAFGRVWKSIWISAVGGFSSASWLPLAVYQRRGNKSVALTRWFSAVSGSYHLFCAQWSCVLSGSLPPP